MQEMRTGKAERSVLRNSVMGRIRNRREETLSEISEASDAVRIRTGETALVSTGTVTGKTDDPCYYAFYRALNKMAAAKGEPLAVTDTILLPEGTDRDLLKSYIDRLQELAEIHGVDIAGGHTEVTSAVHRAVFSVSCIGKPAEDCQKKRSETVSPGISGENGSQKKVRAGCSVILTKHTGLEGTSILAAEKEEILAKRFDRWFLKSAKALKDLVPALSDARVAFEAAPVILHSVSEGGILSALWDLAASYECGLDIDLRAVPIRQETIEICEFFGLNPYELSSGGSMLILTDEPETVTDRLSRAGIPGTVIGRTTGDRQKILRTFDSVQCMNRPSEDALLLLERREGTMNA